MTKSLSERIRSSRIDAGLTQQELGKQCGVSRAAVALWENGDTKSLKVDSLLKASKALRKSFVWLADGKGPEDGKTSDVYEEIPMVESFYHGGDGDGMERQDDPAFLKTLSFRRDWLEYVGLDPEFLKVAMVHGKSMEPELREADVILVDKRENKLEGVENGAIYALTVNGAPLVKHVYVQELGGVVLESVNKSFKDIEIPKGEITALEVVGRVVWRGGEVG